MSDPALLDILKELQKHSAELSEIRNGIAAQNSWTSFASLHGWDFIVILLADVMAAGIALVTFEAWRESDNQNTSRAERVLSKLSPHMGPLITFLEPLTTGEGNHTSYATPWANRSAMHSDFADASLSAGSIDWLYPGGEELSAAFAQMMTRMKEAGGTVGKGPNSRAVGILASAKAVETLRVKQLKMFASGKKSATWGRFFDWISQKRKTSK